MGIRLGSYASAIAQMTDASDELELAWARTKEDWNDGNSRHFEEHYLKPLLQEVKISSQAIRNFMDVLGKADRACSPEREGDYY